MKPIFRRSCVCRLLALDAPKQLDRRMTRALQFAVVTALMGSLAGGAGLAQGVYRQGLVQGLSSFDVGWDSAPCLADLDGDGDLDISAGEKSGTIHYFENMGSREKPIFLERTAEFNPFFGIDAEFRSRPALVDLDGDGDLDMAVGTGWGLVRYFENIGNSTLADFVERSGAANPFAALGNDVGNSPDLADLDGDGDLDMVAGDTFGSLRYFQNIGNSTTPSFLEVSGAANPFFGIDVGLHSTPELADVDGDGDLDAVVGEAAGALKYLENIGNGREPAFLPASAATSPLDGIDVGFYSSPHLGDLDGDGDLDAVVGEMLGELRYLENLGTSATLVFEERKGMANPFPVLSGDSFIKPVLADVDGDGDLDAVVGKDLGDLSYLENIGLPTSPVFAQRAGTANPFSEIDVGLASKPALADLDGDGDLDVAVGELSGSVRYFENIGSSTVPAFAERTGAANPFAGIDVGDLSAPDLADLDGDGDLDAVIAEVLGSLRYFENIGSPVVAVFLERAGAVNPFQGIEVGYESSPALVDLDGDGDLDAVVGEEGGHLVFLGSSAATPFVRAFEN